MPHLVDLGEVSGAVGRRLTRPDAWDALRTHAANSFGLATSRADLEAMADREVLIGERMRVVAELLAADGTDSVASYGAGTAVAEAWLLRHRPGLALALTENAPGALARLRELFDDATVVRHDLRADGPLDAQLHLLHRVDTEFSNAEWRAILRRFAQARVLVIATDVLDRGSPREELRRLRRARARALTFAGWSRSAPAFEGLWADTHVGRRRCFGDLHGWVLTPR